jgi:hypothetical protein
MTSQVLPLKNRVNGNKIRCIRESNAWKLNSGIYQIMCGGRIQRQGTLKDKQKLSRVDQCKVTGSELIKMIS